jgi:hypothetical protein
MDVAVDQKRGQGRLQSIRTSFLGDGLLERARATTLGLLGAAAVVGLAMLALVFNQGWPLIAGAPVPPLPPREQDVAKAKVVATGAHRQADVDVASPSRQPGGDTGGEEPGPATQDSSTRAPSSELVVVQSAPVKQPGDAPPSGGHTSPAPANPKTPPAPQTQTDGAEQVPASPPAPAPAPTPEATPPPATASGAPESSVPPWSNGKGHAYGRSEAPGSASAGYDYDDDPHDHGHGDD